jgi:hypothetical protein
LALGVSFGQQTAADPRAVMQGDDGSAPPDYFRRRSSAEIQ